MNATKARQILRKCRELKPEHAKLSTAIVARKARRYYTDTNHMPSKAQIIRWFQRKPAPKEMGATMPVKQPSNNAGMQSVPKPKPAPWYRRFWLWLMRVFGAKQ